MGGAQGGEGRQGGGGDSEWGAQRGEGLAERVRGPGERVRAGTGVERRGGDLGFSKLRRGLYSWDWVERPLNVMCRILSALTLSEVISDFSPGSDFDVQWGENSPSLELASAVTGMLACVKHRLWTGGGGICSKIVCTGTRAHHLGLWGATRCLCALRWWALATSFWSARSDALLGPSPVLTLCWVTLWSRVRSCRCFLP